MWGLRANPGLMMAGDVRSEGRGGKVRRVVEK
jgi:hypothetical protein